MVETSIIVRTKNEQEWVGECLERIYEQTYKSFEVVIVDSGSTDRTLEIVKKFPVRLLRIKPEEFTYPFAINHGCKNANAEKYFVILSAHSLPRSTTWLADGLENFADKKIAGVYGIVYALPNAGFWEKLFFNKQFNDLMRLFWPQRVIKKDAPGVLGFTNAIIRRDLWEQHPIDERYANGGEDDEWVRHWVARGYSIMRDMRFSVAHSHGLGLRDLRRQFQHWHENAQPMPFEHRDYR